ncbi:DUF262 domain-containing protein [Candidatus Nitronereus thalassa]|uniref:DUF262 domain-containing protein n=1 Tax=Candidatus Nitronereus thalassa TaxID=3020898 RepID=A0ABU3K8D3_9BACT|nr:DUF262 domain-containing protein [Candidatus Nitronereus thalassa]MDT7042672.1 DUF262 domain-containing protein [Candidatus Nitronereus thalassa]
MSYKSKIIKEIIDEIDQRKIYLPALQRKFVWGKQQIEQLFDSLMRNYPFGTFLFWRLHRKKAESYVFYEFLAEYDERSPYNRRKTGAFSHPEIIGVLDGQQRLSSIYIGLMGTHTEKAPYKRSSNPNAYEKMCLFLNLLSLPYNIDAENRIVLREDRNFEFCFLTQDGAVTNVARRVTREDGTEGRDEAMYWMKVGQVLSWEEDPEFDKIIEGFMEDCPTAIQKEAFARQKRLIKKGLQTLYNRIHIDRLVNYFEVAKDDLEDILKIFVRVNSGGTVLSKTDLLFSTIVATWDDGREQIENLLKTINQKGDGFSFGNEYLMRCCLVLSDGPVVYKVNSFRYENVQKIRDEWPKIAEAITKTADMLVEFGFSNSTLTSQNATIVIAYYLYKGGNQSKESKEAIRKYLIHALLNGIYGSAQDQLISVLRNAFRQEIKLEAREKEYRGRYDGFSFEDVLKIELPQQKTLAVTESDLERFLQNKKGPTSFFLLSLLYPHLRFNEVAFHQDHIHPAAGFNEKNFQEMRIPDNQWNDWYERRDCVPNLQLLEGRQNERKKAIPLKMWVDQMSESKRISSARENYFPDNVDLEFKNFMDFFKKRKEVLRKELKQILAMTKDQPSGELAEWERGDDEVEAEESVVISPRVTQ